jgi:hypothetical protein
LLASDFRARIGFWQFGKVLAITGSNTIANPVIASFANGARATRFR